MSSSTNSNSTNSDPTNSDPKNGDLLAAATEMLDNLRAVSIDGAGVTRPSYGAAESAAHGILRQFAEQTGLQVRVDGALNTWVDLVGTEPDRPMIVTGSHLDSVRCGGNFDGAAGVVAGLLALRQLQNESPLSRTVSLVAFRGEESAWFGTCYIGSRALTGRLDTAMLSSRSPESGLSLEGTLFEAGADLDKIVSGTPLMDVEKIYRFLEVHIEQGPNLVSQGMALGAVTGIRGNRRYANIGWTGESGHSGAVPRPLRHDAVLGIAQWITEVEYEWTREEGRGSDLVVTHGVLSTDARRHGVTSIAGTVKTSLDIRSVDPATMARFDQRVVDKAHEIAQRRGLSVSFGPMVETAPAQISEQTVTLIEKVAAGLNQPITRLPSGAGHDAAALAAAGVEVGMIFVRNMNGSHNPDEAMEVADLCLAVPVLAGVIRELGSNQKKK